MWTLFLGLWVVIPTFSLKLAFSLYCIMYLPIDISDVLTFQLSGITFENVWVAVAVLVGASLNLDHLAIRCHRTFKSLRPELGSYDVE